MSIISLTSYELHLSKDLRVDGVANVMNLKWYEFIRHYLNTNGNMEKKDDSSRLLKSRTHGLRFAY